MENKINEGLARQAKHMMSFNDYQDGTATARYNSLVNSFKASVDQLKQQYPKGYEQNQEAVEYWTERYAARLANAINRENQIACYCPSIMITGGANFPVRKKQKQNNMMAKFWSDNGYLFDTDNYMLKKIDAMLSNRTIYSNDELAMEKLQDKLKELEEKHAHMKAANAHYKKHGTMADFEDLTDEQSTKWTNAILGGSWGLKVPYQPYELSNSLGVIKNTKERIEKLQQMKDVQTEYKQVDGVEIKENKQLMRIQLLFDGKPSDEIRELLKSNGFRWSPREKAWQRQLTQNGIRATQKMLEKI